MYDCESLNKNCGINNEKDALPFTISRLNRDLSETGSRVEVDDIVLDDNADFTKHAQDNEGTASKMPFSLIQQCLVNNFDACLK